MLLDMLTGSHSHTTDADADTPVSAPVEQPSDLHKLDSTHTIYQQVHHTQQPQYCCTTSRCLLFKPVPQLTTPLCSHYNKYAYCPYYSTCRYLHIHETDYSKYSLLHRKPTKQHLKHHPNSVHSNISTDFVAPPATALCYTLHNLNAGEERQFGLLRRTLELNGMHIVPHKQLHSTKRCILYFAKSYPSLAVQSLLHPNCQTMHCKHTTELSHKDRLLYNIRKATASNIHVDYTFYPQTYVLPFEHEQLRQQHRADTSQLWICKPYAAGEGHSIVVTDLHTDHYNVLNNCTTPMSHVLSQPHVVSRYIADPLLINQRKFDLRLYVALTQRDSELAIWLYNDGLVRFCISEYNVEKICDVYSHLTNNSINNTYNDSTQLGTLSNWSVTQLKQYFVDVLHVDYDTVIQPQIEHAIKQSVLSAAQLCSYMRSAEACNTFELFGVDIMVNSRYKAYLLEYNSNPTLTDSNKNHSTVYSTDYSVKSTMLADLFTLLQIGEQTGEQHATDCMHNNAAVCGGFKRL